MNLNITVNEAGSLPPVTAGTFNVRVRFNDTDAGQVSGPFASRESAEAFAQKAMCRDGVLRVEIEEAV